MMHHLLHHESAPNVETETFTGNPLGYHYFMLVFKETFEYKIDPHRRLVWHLKYSKEEAREAIKLCIQQPLNIGYDRAKLLLEQHYGDPDRIFAVYRKEIKAWPSMKPDDSSAYWKLCNLLIKYESIMSQQQWNSLNSSDILCILTSNLPGNAWDKWNRKVVSIWWCRVKDQSWQILSTSSMMRLCWPETHLFSRAAIKVYAEKEEKNHLNQKMKSCTSNTKGKV